MRRSAEGQAAFRRAEECDDEDWMEEAARMQCRALERVGLAASERNLALLRAAALDHPELALYVRHNRCRQGTLSVGDVVPTIQLFDLQGDTGRAWPCPTAAGAAEVIFAGSVS